MTHKPVILLTASVRPGFTANTKLLDSIERKKQYIDALEYYLSETDLKVVFCENTGTNLYDEVSNAEKLSRCEYISFWGNDYDKTKGKGYGEAKIVQYAIDNSQFISETDYIIKITGRVKITNINEIIRKINTNISHDVGMEGWGRDWIQSICFYCPKSWMQSVIEVYGEDLDDFTFCFQKMLYMGLLNVGNMNIVPIYPIVVGISGKTNRPYTNNPIIQRKIDSHLTFKNLYGKRNTLLRKYKHCIEWLTYRFFQKIQRKYVSNIKYCILYK